MAITAGVLLGLAVLAWLVGFHLGPHAHLVAGVLGIVAAAWLVIMFLDGQSAPVLWALLGVALVISATAVVISWYGLTGRGTVNYNPYRLEGAEGIAVGDLAPEGHIRVRGELWSATSVNGIARTGTRVQVLRVSGLHLEVWAEEPEV